MDSNRLDRWRGPLWGLFVGDALAMPVHWYYDVATGHNQMTSRT